MKFCLSEQFNPSIYKNEDNTQQALIYINLVQLVLLALYIIIKMCKLCKIAYSYSNFYVHQAYKFYTLALISNIMILVSKLFQFEFANNNFPEKNKNYQQGWVLFNEVIGIITIYSVTLMYALNSLALLIASKKIDFNGRQSLREMEMEQIEEQYNNSHRFNLRLRAAILYFIIPGCMLFSIFTELSNNSSWCIVSKTFSIFCNFIVFIIMFFTYFKMFLKKQNHELLNSIKMKVLWIYIIIAITIRQSFIIYFHQIDFTNPQINKYHSYQGNKQKLTYNILSLIYTIFISTLPILLLSFQADKQLQLQKQNSQEQKKQRYQKTQRLIYSSTII